MTDNQAGTTAAGTGLSPRAEGEIERTFNSLTNRYATVEEYIAYEFPGSDTWRGDSCGCTDDRCTGYHHDGPECGCLDVQLDDYHDDLVAMHQIRDWLQKQPDQDAAITVLTELQKDPRDLESRLDPAQQALLAEVFTTVSFMDPSRAVHKLGVDVLQHQPAVDDQGRYPFLGLTPVRGKTVEGVNLAPTAQGER